MYTPKFTVYRQLDAMDCGPTCLRMIARHYGRSIQAQTLRDLSETHSEGSSLLSISYAAEQFGFKTVGVRIDFKQLIEEVPLPCIAYWGQEHFVIIYKIKNNKIYIADPAHGLLTYTKHDFLNRWIGKNYTEHSEGILLLLEPTPEFFKEESEKSELPKNGFSILFQYLLLHKSLITQLLIGLVAGSVIQFFFPFLTQSIVDIGIQNQEIKFIYLILLAQLLLFFGKMAIDIFRGWLLLHLSTRINISLVSDFLIKLMKLPISFFDNRMTGDILNRIYDHRHIEEFMTSSSLSLLFSIFNMVIFGVVLAYYSLSIFIVFLVGSVFYFLWIMLFLKQRADLNYKNFSQVSEEQSKVIELVNGMQEIKLHNAERKKRWSWEYLKARQFRIQIKELTLEQYQIVGSNFINELKNILITVLAAKLVLDGELTLGMMLSVSYIVGQLNGPIVQLVNFLHDAQDARISLERISQIHGNKEEENKDEYITDLSKDADADLTLNNISFRYIGAEKQVLKELSLIIPANKVTAIVGSSGGGKTTLMKILLKFYKVQQGEIKFGSYKLNNIDERVWRAYCGVVMQEGYIFNDTIANNIAVGVDYVDKVKLRYAVEVANIQEFIEKLPLAYNTKIGNEGLGLSTGQKQRILIARAVYKDPKIILFDEATSALDASNEKIIMTNLNRFFKQRTAIIIAHRLSTVKNADQIVVLDQGTIVETGNHSSLIAQQGVYYHLVKDQLELEKVNGYAVLANH